MGTTIVVRLTLVYNILYVFYVVLCVSMHIVHPGQIIHLNLSYTTDQNRITEQSL